MPEDLFRIVVTVAVALAVIAFVVQSAVILAMYGLVRKLRAKVESLIDKAEPLIAKAGPVIDRAGPMVDSVKPLIAKAGVAMDKTTPILEEARRILEEARPRVAEVSQETVAIVKSARVQVDRAGELLRDAGERARTRLAQIDESVEHTVEQVENVGGAVKRVVMKPVREVNGLAAGVSAVVGTLVHGSRKSSVDSATQDEEMFI